MASVEFLAASGPVAALDGGLATELEARGHDLSDDLWSARLLRDDPAAIKDVTWRSSAPVRSRGDHRQLPGQRGGLRACGVGPAAPSGCCAAASSWPGGRARTSPRTGAGGWVAASVGPYGAMLADGQEYRGRYGLDVTALTAWHRPRLEVLAAAGPDLLACETVPDVDEAEALLAALVGLGVPAWLSATRSAATGPWAGQPLTEAFAVARRPAGDRCRRGELQYPDRRGRRGRRRARGQREAGRRLPEQRGGLYLYAAQWRGGALLFTPERAARWIDDGAPGWSAAAAGSDRPTSPPSPTSRTRPPAQADHSPACPAVHPRLVEAGGLAGLAGLTGLAQGRRRCRPVSGRQTEVSTERRGIPVVVGSVVVVGLTARWGPPKDLSYSPGARPHAPAGPRRNRGWRPFGWPGCSASSSGATVFRRSAGGRRLRLLAGSNEAMFVCVDDGLDPVAESKFHEDAGDMRLDRRIADDEGCGDRGV